MSYQSCPATTQRGTPCRAFVPPGRERCIMHDPSMADAVATARIKGGEAAAKIRMLQGRRLKLDTAAGVVRFASGVIQDTLAGTIDADLAKVVLYGCGIQLRAVEQAKAADVEIMLAEVRKLTAAARMRGRT